MSESRTYPGKPGHYPFKSWDEVRAVLSRMYDNSTGAEANALQVAYHCLPPTASGLDADARCDEKGSA